MTPSLVIRPAGRGDLDGLTGLYSEFRNSLERTSPSDAEFRSALERLIGLPEVRIYLAKIHEKPVGYVAVRFFFSAWEPGGEALLEDLYVAPEYRAQRVGRQLVESAITEAKARGCRSMSLDTNENNPASNALYRGLGFTSARARWSGGRQIRYDLKLARPTAQ